MEKEVLLYGGNNKQNPPFNIGDRLKQIWRVDDNDNLIEDGREMYEYVGMKGNMMLIKTLNYHAANGEDILSVEGIKKNEKLGYKPEIGKVLQLHYMYADRYKVV